MTNCTRVETRRPCGGGTGTLTVTIDGKEIVICGWGFWSFLEEALFHMGLKEASGYVSRGVLRCGSNGKVLWGEGVGGSVRMPRWVYEAGSVGRDEAQKREHRARPCKHTDLHFWGELRSEQSFALDDSSSRVHRVPGPLGSPSILQSSMKLFPNRQGYQWIMGIKQTRNSFLSSPEAQRNKRCFGRPHSLCLKPETSDVFWSRGWNRATQ